MNMDILPNGFASRMIRSGHWKCCCYHGDREELFNLHDDPEETVNLVNRSEHRELVASLKKRARKRKAG